MIWALLAVLGVPIWLVVGALCAVLWSRRSFSRQPGAFRAKLRPASDGSWPRRSVYARVVHDVLVVNSGLALVRTSIHGVRTATVVDNPDPVAGLTDPVVLALTFDSGQPALLATEAPVHRELETLVRAGGQPAPGSSTTPGEPR